MIYGFKGGMMGGHGSGIFGMVIGLIFLTAFIVGSVLLIVWIVRQFAPSSPSTLSSSNALEILKERFAKGEISKEEFSDMKKELMK